MEQMIKDGSCIDLSECERTTEGYYIVTNFVEGVDYCDAKTESWIWSIGKRFDNGKIHASLSANLYEHNEYECIWLR